MPEVREVVRLMRESGVELGRGMGEGELSLAEASCNVRFPRSLRALLSAALPLAETTRAASPTGATSRRATCASCGRSSARLRGRSVRSPSSAGPARGAPGP